MQANSEKPTIKTPLRTLSLVNALYSIVDFEDMDGTPEVGELRAASDEIDNIILKNGATAVGPLILNTWSGAGENGSSRFYAAYIRQTDSFISGLEPPFRMEGSVYIPNCIYKYYEGEKSGLASVFFEAHMAANEEGGSLRGEAFTFLLSQDLKAGTIAAELYFPAILPAVTRPLSQGRGQRLS